ncbi:50S ribosomal protein L35 [Candidatus Hodgkinia cicadicola]|nr:50S ribosomal protein L35 [Candidatus Hodgkinia cicadicola]
MIHKTNARKLKTKSAFKKRFKLMSSGNIKAYCACRRHKLYRRSKSSKQSLRGFLVCKSDLTAIKRFLYC